MKISHSQIRSLLGTAGLVSPDFPGVTTTSPPRPRGLSLCLLPVCPWSGAHSRPRGPHPGASPELHP